MSKPENRQQPDERTAEILTLSVSQSTRQCSAAILRGRHTIGKASWDNKMMNNHEIFRVLPMIFSDSGVTASDIELFSVDIGPGSFAGIRTAISTINGMALPDRKPVIGISCGMAIAHEILTKNKDKKIVIVGDARRQRLWHAQFQFTEEGTSLCQDYELITKDNFASSIPADSIVATPDWLRLDEFLTNSVPKRCSLINSQSTPTAETIATLALQNHTSGDAKPGDILPLYMHPPVIESSRK